MTIEQLEDGRICLLADEGYYITNGFTAGPQVYLGIHDSISNWYEIPIPEEE